MLVARAAHYVEFRISSQHYQRLEAFGAVQFPIAQLHRRRQSSDDYG